MFEDNIKQKILEEIYNKPNSRVITTEKQSISIFKWVGFLSLFLMLIGGFLFFMENYRLSEKNSYFVPMKIKTISEKGYPVAGVSIKVDDKKLGTSDSFGDWQGIVELNASNKYYIISLSKKNNEGFYFRKLKKYFSIKKGNIPLKMNIGLKFRSLNKKIYKSSSKKQSTFSLKFVKNGNSSVKTRNKESMIENKMIPLLSRNLSRLGILEEKLSFWKVHLDVIPKKNGFPLLRGVNQYGNKISRFLIHLSKPSYQVAEEVIAHLKKSTPIKYTFNSFQNNLYFADLSSLAEIWWPKTGDLFRIKKGNYKKLILKDTDKLDKALVLPLSNCPNEKNTCKLFRVLDKRALNSGLFDQFKVKISTPSYKDTEVYVSGVHLKSNRIPYFNYIGKKNQNAFLVILFKNRFYGAYRIKNSKKQTPIIKIQPSTEIAKSN